MSEKKNDIFKWFVIVLLLVVIGVDFYCFIIPASIGHGMVIKEIIKYACAVILGIIFLLLGILLLSKQFKPVYAAVLLVLFGIAGVLLGINNCYKGFKGLNAGIMTIENGEYTLDYHYSKVGEGKFYIVTNSNNSIQRIRIDKYTYDYLGTNHHDVQISYYPYINIADEIIYK